MAGSEQRPTDDVEGHMPFKRQDTEAIDEDQVGDDTQGHGKYFQETEATDEDQAGDDTEGHGIGRAVQDAEATDEDQVGDAEGHRFRG